MTKYRVLKDEKFPDQFVYVPQEKVLWFWSSYVGLTGVRTEFQTEIGAVEFIREQAKFERGMSKPKVVWRADTNTAKYPAGSDTIFRD